VGERTGKTREREREEVGDGGGEGKEEGTRVPHRCVSFVNGKPIESREPLVHATITYS
jgi:hypothetical protein